MVDAWLDLYFDGAVHATVVCRLDLTDVIPLLTAVSFDLTAVRTGLTSVNYRALSEEVFNGVSVIQI